MTSTTFTQFGRKLLIVLDGFQAVTAVVGGIGLLTGLNAPPAAALKDSVFSTYTIPGLGLLVFVGGIAAAATVLMALRHRLGLLTSGVAAVMVIVFEIVEVLVIGSPRGVARNLQVVYFTLGVVMVGLATAVRAFEGGRST